MDAKHHVRRGREETFVEQIVLVPYEVGDPQRDLMSAVEAAELLGISSAAVGGLLDRGSLRTVRRSGSRRRWLLREEVFALAERRGGVKRGVD